MYYLEQGYQNEYWAQVARVFAAYLPGTFWRHFRNPLGLPDDTTLYTADVGKRTPFKSDINRHVWIGPCILQIRSL